MPNVVSLVALAAHEATAIRAVDASVDLIEAPKLTGRWGAARLAHMTGAPVIPIGLWGTEKVWPRSSRAPKVFNVADAPTVFATVGTAVELKGKSLDKDTKRIMKAIRELLPPEAQVRHDPTPEQLAASYPPGWKGDPEAEHERRPGTD